MNMTIKTKDQLTYLPVCKRSKEFFKINWEKNIHIC